MSLTFVREPREAGQEEALVRHSCFSLCRKEFKGKGTTIIILYNAYIYYGKSS